VTSSTSSVAFALSAAELTSRLAPLLRPNSILRQSEPLARRTTLRVGGPADVYVEPAGEEDLATTLGFCRAVNVPFLLLGRGSNLLVRDGGFRGVVISLAQPYFTSIETRGNHLHCGAGTRLKLVAVEAKHRSLCGLEFLEGIPGSVGGALRMNAGAMGGAMFDIVEAVTLMDFEGHTLERASSELQVQYRSCPTLSSHIAIRAVLRGQPGDRETIERRMMEYSRKRWQTQPAAPSAGCMFKNPTTAPAGRIIDELGLKGLRVGGAYVSAEHGNFIVNDGSASARDVLTLIETIRNRVQDDRGVTLETEVEIVGQPE
jgi:UDP-N-acetylenolpyruvoylglucosamine reductase